MSDNILDKICATKHEEILEAKSKLPLEELQEKLGNVAVAKSFINALKKKSHGTKPAIIAEVKKQSPSKGIIREDFNPVEIAQIYEENGAACLSVLTDEQYFGGNNQFLVDIKNKVKIPCLRKDFILDDYQVFESRALGADCILLIVACLEKDELIKLEELAHNLGMDVLVEVHDTHEMEIALSMKSELIGINNRNLKTFETSLDTGKELVKMIPDDYIKVCESGIYEHSQVEEMMKHSFKSFLVGESLMREKNIGLALKNLIGE